MITDLFIFYAFPAIFKDLKLKTNTVIANTCVYTSPSRLVVLFMFYINVVSDCAHDEHEYTKTGMVGRMFFCATNGNYEVIQCHGSVCFCADRSGKQVPGSQSVGIWEQAKLEC